MTEMPAVRYESPRIVEREAIDLPLVAFGSPAELATSASFRPV
jgi:hypothetical protein